MRRDCRRLGFRQGCDTAQQMAYTVGIWACGRHANACFRATETGQPHGSSKVDAAP